VICLGFGVWGTPGSEGQVVGVILVPRTFPESLERSVQNLAEIGAEVRGRKFYTGTYTDTNSLFYIYRLANRDPALPGKLIK